MYREFVSAGNPGMLHIAGAGFGVLGTHFSAYNPEFPLLRSRFLNKKPFIYRFFAQKLAPEHL